MQNVLRNTKKGISWTLLYTFLSAYTSYWKRFHLFLACIVASRCWCRYAGPDLLLEWMNVPKQRRTAQTPCLGACFFSKITHIHTQRKIKSSACFFLKVTWNLGDHVQLFAMKAHLAFTWSGSSAAEGQLTARGVRLPLEWLTDRTGPPGSSLWIQPRQNSLQPQPVEHYHWQRWLFNLKEANQPPESLTTSATSSSEAKYHLDTCQILVSIKFPPKPLGERTKMERTSEFYLCVNILLFFLFSYLRICCLKLKLSSSCNMVGFKIYGFTTLITLKYSR